MPTLTRLLRFALVLAAPLSFALPSAQSGEAAGASMTISRGTIVGASANNGQPVRATVGNLAGELMRRYPSVTINVVGVEDVLVDDVTVRWPRATDDPFLAVNAVLQTLAQAAEPQKFTVANLPGNQFILGRPRNPEGVGALRRRRRVRALVSGAAASLVLGAVCATLVHRRPPAVDAPLPHATPVAQAHAAVKWIDDDQLLARFSDRGAVLVGPPRPAKARSFRFPPARRPPPFADTAAMETLG